MNQNLQGYSSEIMAAFPLLYDKEKDPCAGELDKIPSEFRDIIIAAAQRFDALIPETMPESQMRELRRNVYRLCRYIFATSGTLILVDKTVEAPTQESVVYDEMYTQRVKAVLEVGRLEKEEFLQRRDNDLEWGVLGMGDLNEREREGIYYYARRITKITDQYGINDDVALRMIIDVDKSYWVRKIFLDIEDALWYVREFYEDTTEWGDDNVYDW